MTNVTTAVKTEHASVTMVREFHTIFGHLIRPEFFSDEFLADLRNRITRTEMIDEEVGELKIAYTIDKSFIEVIDALADIVYLTAGAALLHGVSLAPHIKEPMFSVPQNRVVDSVAGREIVRRFRELADDYTFQTTPEGIVESLEGLIAYAYEVADNLGVDLHEVVTEVHRSNLTKLDEDGNPIYKVAGDPTSKVIKGPNFENPRIELILDRQLAREAQVANA